MGEPDTPAGGPRPDDSVLEELAQAFHDNQEEVSGHGEPTARSHDHGWKAGSESDAGDTVESGETNLDDAPVDDIPVEHGDELDAVGSGGEVGSGADDDEVASSDDAVGSGADDDQVASSDDAVGSGADDDEVASADDAVGSGADDDEVASADDAVGSGADDDEVASSDDAVGSGADDDQVASSEAASWDDDTQLSAELPAAVGEIDEVESDGDAGDEPAGREGGMIGEPTVARRTIRIVDELPDDTTDGGSDVSGASDSDTDDRRTIHIGADEQELPDAVYLDEELERDDGSSGTVFIDDEGVDDALAPKDATRPGIEPRLRQRRIGVRRAASRRRLWLALGGVVIVLVIVGGLAVLGSPLFSIDNVKVTGAQYTEGEVLDQVISDLDGSPVLTADTDAAEDRLEESPWVESARVRTDFPDTVTIEIRERVPLLTMRGVDGLFRVLDREGRVLASIEGQPVAMVLVQGPGTLDVEPGSFTPIGYASAASLVTKLTPTVRARVDHVLVTADGSDLRLILTNDPNPPIEVEFGSALGDNEQVEKLVRLERVLEDIGTDPVTVINVSTADVTVL